MNAAKPAKSPRALNVCTVAARPPATFPSRRFLLACCVAVFLAGNVWPRGQAGKAESDDSYTVRGTVVNGVTHAAVAHALVFSSDNRMAQLTDGEGRFEFKVPRTPGEQTEGGLTVSPAYSGAVISRVTWKAGAIFMARKPGFFQSQAVPGGTGAEDSGDLKIELVPEALVVGRVNLAANDGTEKIQVQIYRRQVQDGRGQWTPAGSVPSQPITGLGRCGARAASGTDVRSARTIVWLSAGLLSCCGGFRERGGDSLESGRDSFCDADALAAGILSCENWSVERGGGQRAGHRA